MAVKKQPIDKLTLAVIALIALVVAFFIYNFILGIKAPVTSINNIVSDFKAVNLNTVAEVKTLNVCGNWPFLTVSLSAERGNPFSRKAGAPSQMVATDVAQCRPITQ